MSRFGRVVGVLVAIAIAGSVGGLLVLFSPLANAEEEPIATANELADPDADKGQDPPPRPEDIRPLRDFFTLYPAGPDAQSYEELDEYEKAYVARAGEWAEVGNGHAVHNSWAKASRQKRKEAKAHRAQQLSGTQGLGEIGVE